MLKLVKKINAVDTGGLVEKTDFDANMKAINGDMPSIAELATTAVLNAGQIKMPGAGNLVRKKKKKVMMQKYLMFIMNTLGHLTIINLWIVCLM